MEPGAEQGWVPWVALAVALPALNAERLRRWWSRRPLALPSDSEIGVVNAILGGVIAVVALPGVILKIAGAGAIVALGGIQLRQAHERDRKARLALKARFRRRILMLYDGLEELAQDIYFRSVRNHDEMRKASNDDDVKLSALAAERATIEREKEEALKTFKFRLSGDIVLVLHEMEDQLDMDCGETLKLLEPHRWDITFDVIPKIRDSLAAEGQRLENV